MSTFTDLENAWQQQSGSTINRPKPEALIQLAEQKAKQIRYKHRASIIVLSVTMLIILWYFLMYAANAVTVFSVGLLMMIGSLFIRIVIEYFSYRKLHSLNVQADFKTYIQQVTAFYSRRRVIHYMITPLIFATYVAGFILLLPVFKEVFSKGFYIYLLVSGFGSFIVLAYFILKSNRKELRLLAHLKQSAEKAVE